MGNSRHPMNYTNATAHCQSNSHQARLKFRQTGSEHIDDSMRPIFHPVQATLPPSPPPDNSPIFDVPMVEHSTDPFTQKFAEAVRQSYLLEQFGHLGFDDDEDENENEAAQAEFDQELANMFAPSAIGDSSDWSPFNSRAVSILEAQHISITDNPRS